MFLYIFQFSEFLGKILKTLPYFDVEQNRALVARCVDGCFKRTL